MPELKNIRHERFCQEIVAGNSQTEAYRLAGYSEDASAASRISSNVKVSERISELRGKILDKYQVTNERIIGEMARLGFSRFKDYKAILASGDLDDVDEDQSAAITEMTVDTSFTDDGAQVRRVRLKLADKMQSLNSLAKISGLMREEAAVSVPVTFLVQRTGRSQA